MFFLNPNTGLAVYLQLQQQIKQRILSREWVDGSQLPSVRELAGQLKINMLTVSKAYKNLENEGFIETRQGHGTFVAYRKPALDEKTLIAQLEPAIEQLVTEARHLGLPEQKVLDLVSLKFKQP